MNPHQIALNILIQHHADTTRTAMKATEQGHRGYAESLAVVIESLQGTIKLLQADSPAPTADITIERYGNHPPAMWPTAQPLASLRA